MSAQPAVPAFRVNPQLAAVSTSTTAVAAPSLDMASAGAMSVDVAPVDLIAEPVAELVWGCNAVPDCTNAAVIQWAAPAPTDDDPMRTVPVFACADHEGA